MDFIRRIIEQKISQATGAPVRLGKFSFSPLSGGVEVRDLSVGTFLNIKRIEAKIAVARALKQEIVIRSLAIEGPAITIHRDADGKLNLPLAPSRKKTDLAGGTDDKKSWEFEAHKVLLIGGRVAFQDASGYQLALENLTGSLEMKSSDEIDFVFAATSLGRRDQTVELGEAKLLGKLMGGLDLTINGGTMLDLDVRTPAMDSGQWHGEINLAMALPTLLALLPQNIKLPITTATGDARLSAIGSFDRNKSAFNLQHFELRTGPVTLR